MTRTKDLCHPETVRVAASHQAEAKRIAAELAAIASSGMVLPGSITERRTRCGRRNCGCHADPPRLHGPYWQWTRKVAAKTVCRWLSPEQHHDYQAWIDNDRQLRDLLARLEALGAAAFDADPRWERRPRTRPGQPPEPERQPPDRVDDARLTCGLPIGQATFTQVSPKREDLSQEVFTFQWGPIFTFDRTFRSPWRRGLRLPGLRVLRRVPGYVGLSWWLLGMLPLAGWAGVLAGW